ncbi:MAG: ATP-binding protein, partial [Deltaproteobacteria bacterium]|nr:ATP-binding protein [Deltaproteobacteria bacterium]
VGQLAGGIAHDFNNILTALIGYGNLLVMKKGDDELVRSYADHMLNLSEKASSLTQGLLAFSRKQVINPQPVDLNALIRRVEKIFLLLIGEDVELKTVLSEEDITVKADSGQMEHVLMNLATNARDAMPDGGAITIGTDTAELGEEFVESHGYGSPGSYARISFADTGTGIGPETIKRIFEPFFTTKEVGKGTGLGLSMVYGIIKQHNGFIEAESEPGKGTVFRIYLPVTGAGVESPGQAERVVAGGTETILLAEDQEDVRRITKTMLEEFGYEVIAVGDGEDAVRKYKENRDRIGLVVLDMIMPKKSGKEACDEIKKIDPGAKVLFTSGYAPDVMKVKGVEGAGVSFISKPVSPSDFLVKVREVMDE